MRDALKNNDKCDKRKAKVERLNVRAAVVTILEGPAPGEKRKVDYKALEIWPCSSPTEETIRRRRCIGRSSSAFARVREQAQDTTQSRTNPAPIGHQATLYHIKPTLHYTNYTLKCHLSVIERH